MSPSSRASVALGLDVGTSGARALLLSERGVLLGEGTAEYPLRAKRPGWAEQSPADWWNGSIAAAREALEAAGVESVDAIGLCGQMHGTVLLDRGLEPVRDALLWCDSRAADDATAVIEAGGRVEVIRKGGNLPMPGFTAPQLRWLDRAGALGSARWVVCAKDYLRARLTGEVATDPSDASGTGLLGLDGGWNEELAELYSVDARLLPPVLESASLAGHLTAAAAAEIGLPSGIPVATGAADNAAAALGTAVIAPGRLLLSVGTSGTLVVPVEEPRPDESGRCHLFRHALEGTWYSMAVVLSAGGALSWWQAVAGSPLEELAEAAAEVAPGSGGVIALPFLNGRRMPVPDPGARAVLAGMSLAHGTPHLTRAVIEGAAYAMAEGLECIRELGLSERDAVLTGGAARHRLWVEALSLAMPELRLSAALPQGGAALGAALLGFAAAGLDLDRVLRETVRHEPLEQTAFTDADYVAVAGGFDRYRALAAATASAASEEVI